MIPPESDAFEGKLPAAGVYRLTIRLRRRVRLTVGRLGRVDLPAGRYVYCGSAQRNLPARVARHRLRRKPRRWHVDYLTTHPAAEVVAVEARPGPKAQECAWVAQTLDAGGRVAVVGFGASDCRRCRGHLLRID
jgi:Uri superfamily endonuclease